MAVWRESGLFTATERAALDLAEEVTLLATTHGREEVVVAAVAALGEEGAAALLALLVTINAWNAIGVTARCWVVPVR